MLEGASAHQGTEKWAVARDFEVTHAKANRQQRQQEGNDSPLAGVCAVAVHTSPGRLLTAEQAFQPAGMRPPPPIAAGKRRVEELALAVNWLPEEGPAGILSTKQLLVVALLLISMLLLRG